MDEAELLCDRVSILSRGVLKCVDTPLRLRERYCPDYTLTVNFAPGHGADAVLRTLPGSSLISEFEACAKFRVLSAREPSGGLGEKQPEPEPEPEPEGMEGLLPEGPAPRVSEVFRLLEREVAEGRVTDWGLARAGLERCAANAFLRCHSARLDGWCWAQRVPDVLPGRNRLDVVEIPVRTSS